MSKYICCHCNKEYPEQAHQAIEVIIRAMRDATRWSAVVEALSAMLQVELKATLMLEEHERFHCNKANDAKQTRPSST